MKATELNKGLIGEKLSRYGIFSDPKKVRIIKTRPSLFPIEIDFSLIRGGMCGYCGKKYKTMKNGSVYCNRKKCIAKPKFFMTKEKLQKISLF